MPYTNEIECSHSTAVPYEDEMVVAGKGWRIGQYFSGVGATSNINILMTLAVDV